MVVFIHSKHQALLHDLVLSASILTIVLFTTANAEDIFHEWHVSLDTTNEPASVYQPAITINGMFPGPLINATTNDMVHVNVFNEMQDEAILFTWNGIQQRLNSWEDGVSGTNCPILPGRNWTYEFQVKDQIGSFFYFPSLNFQKAGGGFGPMRVNNRNVISVPFPRPEAEFDLLIGDWYPQSYKDIRSSVTNSNPPEPEKILINGKGSYTDPSAKAYESFSVTPEKTYRFRISNVGSVWSINFRIQNHQMLLVETEGSYTNQITLESLDVHVGQSYSVLVTADQNSSADYYIVATPKLVNTSHGLAVAGVGVLHYSNSTTSAAGPLPDGPDPFDIQFSVNQAKSIKWNLTAGAARPNPQGTFNVTNVTLSQTFILVGSKVQIEGNHNCYAVNNVSYITPDTPLKLADKNDNGSGVYQLDAYSTNSTNGLLTRGVFVATGNHRGWIELVFQNPSHAIDTWHLDGFSFFVVGFGDGEWTPASRNNYNLYDPVVRSTVQVYPGGWSAVYAYLDNPGMWNLRSQNLKRWYLGQELYLRVYDPNPDSAKERPPPQNLLLCGKYSNLSPPPPASAPTAPSSSRAPSSSGRITWFHMIVFFISIAILEITQQNGALQCYQSESILGLKCEIN